MVSIDSLRPVYTFLYAIIYGNVIAFFVQKKKSFEILWSKKPFLHTYATLNPPSYLKRNCTHLAWPLPSPFVRTMWMTPKNIFYHCLVTVVGSQFCDYALFLLLVVVSSWFVEVLLRYCFEECILHILYPENCFYQIWKLR